MSLADVVYTGPVRDAVAREQYVGQRGEPAKPKAQLRLADRVVCVVPRPARVAVTAKGSAYQLGSGYPHYGGVIPNSAECGDGAVLSVAVPKPPTTSERCASTAASGIVSGLPITMTTQ